MMRFLSSNMKVDEMSVVEKISGKGAYCLLRLNDYFTRDCQLESAHRNMSFASGQATQRHRIASQGVVRKIEATTGS